MTSIDDEDIQVHAYYSPWMGYYELYMKLPGDKNRGIFFAPPEVREIEAGGCWPSASLDINQVVAQRLLQALWDAGLRPNNGESSVAHVEAMKYHLEDMRKLVFKMEVNK